VRRVALIAAAIVILDQLTKLLVVRFIGGDESRVIVDGFFNLVNSSNTGAAWGIFRDRNVVLAAVSVLTILALYLFRHSFQLHRTGSAIALGLIAGGIVGNLIDRVRVGYVIDFLDFYIGTHHWPAFNVADSSICLGVALYVIVSWRADHAAQRAQTAA
jgi:signal peptidase II